MIDDSGTHRGPFESSLSGSVVIVTGGAGLIGRRLCTAVAESGGVAIVADRDLEAARRVAADYPSALPGCVEAAALDITSVSSVRGLIASVFAAHGRVDAVVNNAYPRNPRYGRPLEDVTYEDFCENVGLHVGGYFLVSQQAGMFFRQQTVGNIVNMSSIYGVIAPRFGIYDGTSMTMPVEYAAIKSSVIQLTRYFAQYFKHDGIRVNCVSPGGILDHQPDVFVHQYNAHCGAKGMLDPVDLVGAVLFLLSDASRYMTGQNLVVDDGFSL